MNYKIPVIRVIDVIVKDIYGDELKMSTKEGYVRFISPDGSVPFHKNAWGNLWVDDLRLIHKTADWLSFDDINEVLELLKHYFSEKYGIEVKEISNEIVDSDWGYGSWQY